MNNKDKKRILVLQASDLVNDYNKLMKDKESSPALKRLVAKYIKAELYNIKKELEKIENDKK